MERKTAKFIVNNMTVIDQLITSGGNGTSVVVDKLKIDRDRIDAFMCNAKAMREYANGKDIQKYIDVDGKWIDIDDPEFGDTEHPYRAKREFIVGLNARGDIAGIWLTTQDRPYLGRDGVVEFLRVREQNNV